MCRVSLDWIGKLDGKNLVRGNHFEVNVLINKTDNYVLYVLYMYVHNLLD